MAVAPELHAGLDRTAREAGRKASSVQTDTAGSNTLHSDRRASRRLELRLPVELRKLGDSASILVRTITRNVSTGGMYIELDRADFAPGDRLDVQFTVPPAEGVSPYAGRASCTAEVLRCERMASDSGARIERYGIAARFLDRLRIRY